MAAEQIAVLDIGTQHTTVLVGENSPDGLVVNGIGVADTYGMKKGKIFDVPKVSACIQKAVKEAADSSNVNIRTVLASCSDGATQSEVFHGSTLLDATEPITEEDMEIAQENARDAIPASNDTTPLHLFRYGYIVDAQGGIMNPQGMRGKKLSVNLLSVMVPNTTIQNLEAVIHDAKLQMVEFVYAPVANAYSVLTGPQQQAGAVLINFGAGTVDYIVFCQGVIAVVGTLAVGGDHITHDLALAFQLSQSKAEEIKLRRGDATIQPELADEREEVQSTYSSTKRQIRVHAIQTVVNARVDETLRIIRGELHEKGVLQNIGSGVFITGGCAALPNIDKLAETIFGLPCHIGTPANVVRWNVLPDFPERMTTAAGLLSWRIKVAMEAKSRPSLFSKFRNLLGN